MPFGYHNSAEITRGKYDRQENKGLSQSREEGSMEGWDGRRR